MMSGNGTGGVNFGNYLNNAMAQEVVVNTGALSAEFELGGVTSNVVTRQGSNTFHGSFSGRYTNSSFQSDNLSADLIDRGLTSGNRIKKIWDANPSAGGPIFRTVCGSSPRRVTGARTTTLPDYTMTWTPLRCSTRPI